WSRNGQPEVLRRFTTADIGTLGNRTPIWSSAVDLMGTWSPARALVGEGTGSAIYALGSHNPDLVHLLYLSEGVYAQNGIPRISAHSAYIEWALTFGSIGAFIGIALLIHSGIRSYRIDSMT